MKDGDNEDNDIGYDDYCDNIIQCIIIQTYKCTNKYTIIHIHIQPGDRDQQLEVLFP